MEEISLAKSEDKLEEIDSDFISSIRAISQKKISKNKKFCVYSSISEEECQKISSYGQLHARANRINSTSMMRYEKIINNPDIEHCSCGCQKTAGQSISVCTNQQNFTFLGPGIILLFFFLNCLRMLVIMVFCSYGIISLISNILSPQNITFDSCPSKNSELDKLICQLNSTTTFNLKGCIWLQQLQLWFGSIALVFWVLGLNFIEFLGSQKNKQIDDLLDSASDYTIMLDNLPSKGVSEKELKDFIIQLWETRQNITERKFSQIFREQDKTDIIPLKIKNIQIIYDMNLCRSMTNKIQQLSVELNAIIDEENKIPRDLSMRYTKLKTQWSEVYDNLNQFRIQFKTNPELRKQISTPSVLVCFDLADQQKQFLQSFQSQNLNCYTETNSISYKGNKISISRAPEPSDLSWENCQKTFSYLRYSLVWILTLIILLAGSAISSYIQTLSFVISNATVAVSIIIQLFNRIIWLSLSFFITFQYHNTKTKSILSLMGKSFFAQSMNVVIGPMINNIIANKPVYGQNSISSSSLYYQFIMFFMMLMFYIINPLYYIKLIAIKVKCIRNLIIRKLCAVVGKIDTVEQIKPVLEFYEGPEFPIAGAYVYMSTAITHTFFYCHLQPILLLILLANMVGFYFIMKYLLFQRCKTPGLTQFSIFKLAIFSVKSGAIFYCVGSLLFLTLDHLQNDTKITPMNFVPSSICLMLCIIINLNPMGIADKINSLVFRWYQFCNHFTTNLNPIKRNSELAFIIIKNLQNLKVIYERKQSYYKFSNLQKLFNFQGELRQTSDIENLKKTHELETFCESFLERSKLTRNLNKKNKRNRFKMAMDDLIFIPASPVQQQFLKFTDNNSTERQINQPFDASFQIIPNVQSPVIQV